MTYIRSLCLNTAAVVRQVVASEQASTVCNSHATTRCMAWWPLRQPVLLDSRITDDYHRHEAL